MICEAIIEAMSFFSLVKEEEEGKIKQRFMAFVD